MNTPTPRSPSFTAGPLPSDAWLWASAMVLAGLIVAQLGRASWHGAPASARDAAGAAMMGADVVSRVGDFSILSFDAGTEDVVVVLDGRTEELFAYKVLNQRKLDFLQSVKVPEIFERVRQMDPNR